MFAENHNGTTRYVGLAPKVVYRIELGMAIVDDGNRLYRLERKTFERVTARAIVEAVESDPEVARIAAALREVPSVFQHYSDRELALASLEDKEI